MVGLIDNLLVRSICLLFLLPGAAFAGEIYGSIDIQPQFYVGKPQAIARRVSLPPPEQRLPASLLIVLEGAPLAAMKFDKPTQPIHLDAGPYGFEEHLLFGQAAVTLEIENKNDRPLKLKADGITLPPQVAPKEKITQVMDKPGRYVIRDANEPLHEVTVVIGPSIYLAQLEKKDGGEFLFDDLPPGDYKVRLYGYGALAEATAQLAEADAHVEQTGRTTVKFTVPSPEKSTEKAAEKPAEAKPKAGETK